MNHFINALAIIVAGLVVSSPVACTMRQNELIAQGIKGGADPIAVKCAIADGLGSQMCMLYVGKVSAK